MRRFIDNELRERYEYTLDPEYDGSFCVLENESDCFKFYRSLGCEDWDRVKRKFIDIIKRWKAETVHEATQTSNNKHMEYRMTGEDYGEFIGIALCSDGEYYYVKDKFGNCHFYEDLKEIEHR